MFRTAVLASGSKGNCVLVCTSETALLVDVGISAKRVMEACDHLRVDRNKIEGILITHEHSDHINGVGAVSRQLQIPVYLTRDTFDACKHRLGNMRERIVFIQSGTSFIIKDLIVHPFASPHDAIDSCNYTFTHQDNQNQKLAVATDIGYQSKLLTTHLSNCSVVVLESNHDLKMLKDGPYPWHLKQRIMSNHGHLSNNDAVGVISQIMHSGLKTLILAHLSEVNNHPDIAEQTMRTYLQALNSDTVLIIADQYIHTHFIDV
jgi:phosphoribosyl 1,2-cyclic phosphodiesterase